MMNMNDRAEEDGAWKEINTKEYINRRWKARVLKYELEEFKRELKARTD